MRARYCDSRTIQFLSCDPFCPDLGDPKALNPYQYGGQNPLSFIDPSGLETFYIDRYGAMISNQFPMNESLFEPVGEVHDDGSIKWYIPVARYKGMYQTLATNYYDLLGQPRPAWQAPAYRGGVSPAISR